MRGACWLVLLACCAVTSAAAAVDSFVPARDDEVVERLPLTPLDPAAQRLRRLRAEVAARPDDAARATRLAWAYIAQGRALADPRYFGYAQGAVEPWWHAADAPPAVLVVRATLRQHDHDFPAALEDLSRALRADPADAQAWLTHAVVQQVRGDYDAARASCLQVLQLATPLLAVTCVSAVDSLSGNAPRAYAALRHALASAVDADAATQRWALATLAEIAQRQGNAAAADAHFRQALALDGRDEYLRGAYADFLLDQHRAAAARDLLRDDLASDALLLRLALAEQALAAPELDDHVRMLRDRFAAAHLRGDTVHRREEACFTLHLAGDAAGALVLARANWEVQREPADLRVLLDAALAARDAAAAQPALEFAAARGLEDVALAERAAALAAVRQ